MDTLWRIQLLGGLVAGREGGAVRRFRTQKAAALLARLAFCPGRPHPREELIEMLWPEADFESGRNNFKQALASLRRQMEPTGVPPGSVLEADRFSVRLRPESVSTDVAAFEAALKTAARSPGGRREALSCALDLWRGDLLPGFYDDWIPGERERLSRKHAWARRQFEATEEHDPAAGEAPVSPSTPFLPFGTAEPAGGEVRLPLQWTRFFGRETELDQIRLLLAQADVRLVTLSGPGGGGKTRLAVEAARRAGPRDGPICFVPLADLSDAGLIPRAIADALRLPVLAASDALEIVAPALAASGRPLLVLDNLEQFGEAGAACVLQLLSRVPALTVLVTSRQRLFLAGERELPVTPLPTPAEGDTTPEQLIRVPSVALFADRAQAARPDFAVTVRNAASVAALCRSLEGLPLSLELAASWAQALTPAQMASRLRSDGGQPGVLAGRGKGAGPARHQTLWATIAWSHDLLPPALRKFWASLSVFRGGWTASAACAVCGEPEAVFLLSQLRARSLVSAEDVGDEMRWWMLETLREFAGEQRSASERTADADAHAGHFLALAEEAETHLLGPDQAGWLDRLDADADNLRAALAHLGGEAAPPEAGQGMAGSLWRFWAVRGHYAEGRRWLEAALARPGGLSRPRAKAANAAGNLARAQGDYGTAQAWFEEALAFCREIGNVTGTANILSNLGIVAAQREDPVQARTLFEEALRLRRQEGDQNGIPFSLDSLGAVARLAGDLDAARAYHEESLPLWEALGDAGGSLMSLGNLAGVALEQGHTEEAAALLGRCLRILVPLGDQDSLICIVEWVAELAARRGRAERAARLWAAANAIRLRVGVPPSPTEKARLQEDQDKVRSCLGTAGWVAAWAAGRAMTTEEAIAEALAETGQ